MAKAPNRGIKQKAKRKQRQLAIPSYVVFISHSSHDSWIASIISEKIEALGAETWLDTKDLAGGDVLSDAIIRGIDACQEAIVLVSPNSVDSKWVAFEIGGVAAQHKRVTPILNNVSPAAMPPIRDIKGIDLNTVEVFLVQLGKRIEQKRIRRRQQRKKR